MAVAIFENYFLKGPNKAKGKGPTRAQGKGPTAQGKGTTAAAYYMYSPNMRSILGFLPATLKIYPKVPKPQSQ